MDDIVKRTASAGIDERFVFTGERRQYVAFPLGGLGTGSVSLTGSGRLIDWSIRNRPAIHMHNGYSHFAIKAERDGKLIDARVLNGPYEGIPTGSPSSRKWDGYGFGANRDTMAGVPHFEDVTFTGRFPFAELAFHRESFPGKVKMTAFSPFIPHNDRDSSMPAALFTFDVTNDTGAAIDYTIAGTLGNYGCDSGIHVFSKDGDLSTLHFTSADTHRADAERGDLAITTSGDGVEHVDYHVRGQWFDSLSLYWREFARSGPLRERRYDKPRATVNMFQQPEHGTLARRIRIAPGETKRVRFAMTWNYPIGSIYWFNRNQPGEPEFTGEPPTWRNYYATQWADAKASGADAMARWDPLEQASLTFRDSLFGSSTPVEIIDAVAGTLGVLRSATLIRLENGELWGWEGQHIREGSCEGSCTHVWNYQQALAYLFPAVERTLRETEFTYNQLPNGGLTFRQRLPLGSGFDVIGPCADGHFGAAIKAYREWKNSGDDAWLKRYWPNIKKAMEYAWSPDNVDRWDPDQTGVLWGRQHHTLDMELFGPNSWLTSMYIAALKATAIMAEAMGDPAFAKPLRVARRQGRRLCRRQSFQRPLLRAEARARRQIRADPVRSRAQGGRAPGFVHGGLLVGRVFRDQISDRRRLPDRPDSWANGTPISPGSATSSRRRTSRRRCARPSKKTSCRPCATISTPAASTPTKTKPACWSCTWPEGSQKPATPVPYAEEVWTGLEYMFASHLIQRGLVEEGLTIVRAARARHDGSRRNPWNDIECGSYYARSLSSYALVNAYIGLSFDQRSGEIGFKPVKPGARHLFLVGWARLGRDRLRRQDREPEREGRRADPLAPQLAVAGRKRHRRRQAGASGTARRSFWTRRAP